MQNFEPTGAAAAMPGSAVPQIKRRLVISACRFFTLALALLSGCHCRRS
jgi:hypothetical protein